MSFWTAVYAIIRKELQIEQRTRQTISVMFMFALSVVVMFNFAVPTTGQIRPVSGGLLWATVLLASTLGLNRSLALERENQTMDALLIAPISRQAIYVGKVISILLFVLLVELVLVGLFVIFFNRPFYHPMILLVLFLGTVGYVAVGVLIASMTIQTRTRDVLLPVLLLPLSLPLVLTAVTITYEYTLSIPQWSNVQSAFYLLLAYDLLMATLGFFTYHYIVEN